MKTRIFEPLGLEHSIVLPADALLHRATVGHFLDPATDTNTRTSHAFLPLSFAPAGSTAMLSARDLVTFGVAHIRDGLGANGTRILSKRSAKAMRTETSSYKGAGIGGFGLGFMLGEGGDASHGGGGPGILSSLVINADHDFAMAVLTNSAHGGTVIGELMKPWKAAATGIEPEEAERLPALDIDFDPAIYSGAYEDIAAEHTLGVKDGALTFSSRAKVKFYDNVSLEPTPPIGLAPVGDNAFAVVMPEETPETTPQTVIRFVNPMSDGRMEHVAMGGRLYRRTQ
jgi:CubicO group peptidase (beta-lactamase class C family)